MNSLGEPTCLDELPCVAACPELLPALAAGDFVPDCLERPAPVGATYHRPEDVGHFQKPSRRETYVYRLQRVTDGDGTEQWHAYGEYCPFGRTASDADYVFLDGGGLFSTRASALWAIHVYLAHLHREAAVADTVSHGRI